jgi:hypothetical protein
MGDRRTAVTSRPADRAPWCPPSRAAVRRAGSRAWRIVRGGRDGAPPAPAPERAAAPSPATALSLQDALRTVGYSLEASATRRARFLVDASGVRIETRGAYGIRGYTWHDLLIQTQAMQNLRRSGGPRDPALDPWTFTRWSVLLRVTGALLDLGNVRDCRIDASVQVAAPPQECRLSVVVGRQIVATTTAIQELLDALREATGSETWSDPGAPTAAERLAATRAAILARPHGRGLRRWWPR